MPATQPANDDLRRRSESLMAVRATLSLAARLLMSTLALVVVPRTGDAQRGGAATVNPPSLGSRVVTIDTVYAADG
jgi:hypothetical protein